MKPWETVHRELGRLALERAAYDAEEAYWIREGHRSQVWKQAGYATYPEYLERMLGIGRKTATERIRTARALGELPSMTEALSDGRIGWTVARELSRVATGETEDAWLEAADGQTVRQVEEMVAGRQPGDQPWDPRDRSNETRVLRFEVSADAYAAFRQATTVAMERAGHRLDDSELIGLAARALAGDASDDEARPNYQLAYVRCPDCETTRAEAAGDAVPVDAATAEMLDCDVTTVASAPGGRTAQTVTPAKRRAVLRQHGGTCVIPGCQHAAFLDIHHLTRQADGGTSHPENLVPLCGAHHHAHHDGRITVSRIGTQITVTHADGTPYGAARELDPDASRISAAPSTPSPPPPRSALAPPPQAEPARGMAGAGVASCSRRRRDAKGVDERPRAAGP